jgi:hypothetical protein
MRIEIFNVKKNQVIVFWLVMPCSDLAASIFTKNMEAARPSKTLVYYHTESKPRRPDLKILEYTTVTKCEAL